MIISPIIYAYEDCPGLSTNGHGAKKPTLGGSGGLEEYNEQSGALNRAVLNEKRRGWDSNPRGVAPYALSRRA